MSRQPAIRPGDTVRLVDPRPILLLGYERTIGTLELEVREDKEVMGWCRDMDLNRRSVDRVVRAVAGNRLDNLKNGERKLVHGDPVEAWRGTEFVVRDRVVRKTGRPVSELYIPGGWYEEATWEGGYLADEKTHVCYRLGRTGGHRGLSGFFVPVPEDPQVPGYDTRDTLVAADAPGMRWPPAGQLWVTREQVELAP